MEKKIETRVNHERYADPTADLAIGRVTREKKMKHKKEEMNKCRKNKKQDGKRSDSYRS